MPQRETGYRFEASGDDDISIIDRPFDPPIPQGTALSRLRFDDTTFSNGDDLCVKYPGDSNYRHFPVIGKSVTFQLPGPPAPGAGSARLS